MQIFSYLFVSRSNFNSQLPSQLRRNVATAVVKCFWGEASSQQTVYRGLNTSSSYLAHPATTRFKGIRGQEHFGTQPLWLMCTTSVSLWYLILNSQDS